MAIIFTIWMGLLIDDDDDNNNKHWRKRQGHIDTTNAIFKTNKNRRIAYNKIFILYAKFY